MRTYQKIQALQVHLFQYRKSRGRYLKDTNYQDLCQEEVVELGREAEIIYRRTRLDVQLVVRSGKRVWRIVER